ncbi:DUF3151 domain-containing protein [Myceligenerans salitolerans]|uniref:DUF3151 domain-containing protein n=1 Tax=Myceligenerans salitolerans TaxID=1230528 RepID=A0ABS3I9J5_9MICO|nr:DUF3151 domain-containing protein [Myceligenerans salitolerans]MBO0609701.1 DUF3151 domain-containing protein [Myceligenerans salitolerans]
MSHDNLLAGPAPVELPDDFPDVRTGLAAGDDPAAVAARHPASSLAWAVLAERALAAGNTVGNDAGNSPDGTGNTPAGAVEAYAYARTGYHRGLDALRRAGWRGQGPVPAAHVPNQGFLRALLALSDAAGLIGETEERDRCRQFLLDSGTSADEVRALAGARG